MIFFMASTSLFRLASGLGTVLMPGFPLCVEQYGGTTKSSKPYHCLSLIPKIGHFGPDMEDRNCDLSFLSEVWEKSENKRHQFKLEELFELKGMKYISTPRPGARRGGGAAIVVNTERFSISKLNVPIKSVLRLYGAS